MNGYRQQLDQLRAARNFRAIPADSVGSDLVDLSGNDYLGIAADGALKAEFFNSLGGEMPALSASASRLLAADQAEFSKLESLLTDLYRRPVLLFNSGYHANSGSIAALAKGRTLIVADKLVHASIIDGMMLSKADFERFRHNDVNHLRRILAKRSGDYERVLIVCESVYSMDGDFAPLAEIAASKTANSLLYVDEAHAFGVSGRDGLGLAVDMPEVDVIIGTLGKAAGSVGAFAAVRSNDLRDYLVNTARSLIFSTALPPINCAWSRFVIERIPSMTDRREQLGLLAAELARILRRPEPSHIQPLITGSSESALELSARLSRGGFKVLPIRTPTVPPGTERLRFSLSASLTLSQLQPLETLLYS